MIADRDLSILGYIISLLTNKKLLRVKKEVEATFQVTITKWPWEEFCIKPEVWGSDPLEENISNYQISRCFSFHLQSKPAIQQNPSISIILQQEKIKVYQYSIKL